MIKSISPTETTFLENRDKTFELYNLYKDLRVFLLKFLHPKDRVSLFSLCRKTRDAFFPIQEEWQGRSFETMEIVEELFNELSYFDGRVRTKVQLL